jgi:Na+-transporting methylmalonyl-CoA/oxaloacetate decarboxylase gamma subunit
MLGQLASLAILFAVVLFLLSLPLGERPAAGALRRAAAFSFILAFVPSLLICAISSLIPRGGSATKAIELMFAGVGFVATLALLSLAAYGFLDLRKRAGVRPPFAEGVKQAKRRPAEAPDEKYDKSGEDEL